MQKHGHSEEWSDIRRALTDPDRAGPMLLGYSLDEKGKVAYAQSPAHKFDSEKRTRTTLGRFLSRRLHVEISPTMHKEIAEIMGENDYSDGDFALRSDVADVYTSLNVHSCMADNPNNCLHDFYESNGVQVLVWRNRARALVWKLSSGHSFIDRVYPSDPNTDAAYEHWAKENGHEIRSSARISDRWPSAVPTSAYVQLTHLTEDTALPYADTFSYLDFDRKRLYCECGHGHSHTLDETEGYSISEMDNGGRDTCHECGERFYLEDGGGFVNDYPYCSYCLENAFYCDKCYEYSWESPSEVDGEFVCDGCATDANTCDHCGQSTFATLSDVGDEDWCDSCIDDSFECDKCGERKPDSDHNIMANGQSWCDDCYIATDSDKCPKCEEHIPFGLPVYSPTHECNICPDCAADYAFGTFRPVRALGGTAIVMQRIG